MTLADHAMKAFALLSGGASAAIAALTLAGRAPAPDDESTRCCAPHDSLHDSPRERHRDEMIRQNLMS
jgi:hypothetical protein